MELKILFITMFGTLTKKKNDLQNEMDNFSTEMAQ
jgi:hypothetical protein